MIKTPNGESLIPTFDWYQFTAKVGIRDVQEVLEPMGAAEPFRQESPKLKGYAWALKSGGRGGSVTVHYGGKNGDDYGPNVQGTGPLSPQVADLFRAAGVPHSVGRADVRLDFLADYEACRSTFIDRCNSAGMSTRDHGSCRESVQQLGRTVYGGSVSSAYQPTMYQKGLQLGDGYPVDFLRLEHRFAFSKAHEKVQLSTLSPLQMLGLRPVARDLSLSIAELAVKPYRLTRYPKEKAPYFWMLSQYGGVLREMHQDHGSWTAVGQQIGLDLEDFEKAHQ